jgi:AraC-like DNA-binding protein
MKPQLLKIQNPIGSSFNYFDQVVPNFPTPWHYHPELEIVMMLESEGYKYIGSSITRFAPGDLVLIGPYLPHFYKNDAPYHEEGSNLKAHSAVIHFEEDFIGKEFLEKPESVNLQKLFKRSKHGIQFSSKISAKLKDDFLNLANLQGMPRLLAFIKILETLSTTTEYHFLTSDPLVITNSADSDRMKRVFEYVMNNFQQTISLEEIASIANMSESAFSRYFKKRTRKTFTSFLNEIRIEHACKLLQYDNMSVSEISYESGFTNLSNFNRQFKAFKKQTPLAYRYQYLHQ